MNVPAEFEGFWSAAADCLRGGLDAGRFLEAFTFGDSEALAAELSELVLCGAKRATASLAATYAVEGKPQPRPGDLSLVISWAREPLCIIETTAVEVLPFKEVTADFARAEGEGDGSLATWRRHHEAFFARECRRLGIAASPRMPVVCERFGVIFQPGRAACAIKAELRDTDAETFVFTAQKTMYGGLKVAAGDPVFVFASENEGGPGLVARGIVTAAEAVPKRPGVARQTPRVSITVTRTARAKRRLGRAELKPFADWNDGRPETELNFKFYRQATNKIVGLSDAAAVFLRGFF